MLSLTSLWGSLWCHLEWLKWFRAPGHLVKLGARNGSCWISPCVKLLCSTCFPSILIDSMQCFFLYIEYFVYHVEVILPFIVTTPKAETMSSQWLFCHGCWPQSLPVQCLAHRWRLRKLGMSIQIMRDAFHQQEVMIFIGSFTWQLLGSSCPSLLWLYFNFLYWSSARVVLMQPKAGLRRRWKRS